MVVNHFHERIKANCVPENLIACPNGIEIVSNESHYFPDDERFRSGGSELSVETS